MKGSTFLKRSLALVLTVVMLVSCWVFTAPTAEAATAGNYTVVVKFNVTDSCGSKYTEDNYITITYKSNNGTGSESTKTWDIDSIVTSGGEKTVSATLGGYPTKVKLNVNNQQGSAWKPWDRDGVKVKVHTVTVQGTAVWTGTIELESDVLEHSEDASIGNSPYAASITAISGDSTVSVSTTNSSVTKTYSLGTVKDQYGVNWYQDASWDTATVSNGVSFSNGTLTVPASSNRANDYTVTLKEKCGNASNTKTVTITVFDYKVTFYDENGTTVLKAEQTVDYGKSATAPSNPTKAYDSSKHYTFNTWTGDGYQNITSGAQTRTVKASYTGTNHSYNQTTVHVDSGTGKTLKSAATCTAAAVYYKTCVCGRVSTSDSYTYVFGDALGHDWTKQTVNDNRLYQAATCLKPAKYYYSCSRCGISEENAEHTFENGEGTGHTFIADSWQQITAEEGYETYQGTTYNASEYHKHSCITAGCSLDDDVDINGKYRTDYDTHNWEENDGKIKWYDNGDGTQCYKKCDDCGYKLYASHSYTDKVTAPTCTDDGYITHTCNTCGYIHIEYPYTEREDENYKALGHNLDGVALSSDAEGHYKVCARCHENIKSDGTIGKDAHTAASAVRENEVAAGCTAVGSYDSVIYCSNPDCGYEMSRTPTVIPALGHDFTVKTVRDETTEKVAPTCLAPGQYYYTCSRCAAVSNESGNELYYTVDDDGEGKALGHDFTEPVEVKATDNQDGFFYFPCANGCGLCHHAEYNGTEYVVAENEEPVTYSEIENNHSKASIPAPYFNDGSDNGRFYQEANINYSQRLASFKYMGSVTGKQTIRFAGSVKIPSGIDYKNVDTINNIVDFGFVYTQTQYITTASDMVIGGENIAKMSVRENNSQKDAQGNFDLNGNTNIDNWTGCTVQEGNNDGKYYLTFNLVININAKNWHKEYACRPYIVYNYNGNNYTVYDSGVSSGTDGEGKINITYFHRSVKSLTDSIMKRSDLLSLDGQFLDETGGWTDNMVFFNWYFAEEGHDPSEYENVCQEYNLYGYINDKTYVKEKIIDYYLRNDVSFVKDPETVTFFKNENNSNGWLTADEANDFLVNIIPDIYDYL